MNFSTPFGNFPRRAFSFFDSVKMFCDERLEILFIHALGFQQLMDPYEFIQIRIERPEWCLISTHFISYHLVSCFFVTDHILMRIPERRKICCPVLWASPGDASHRHTSYLPRRNTVSVSPPRIIRLSRWILQQTLPQSHCRPDFPWASQWKRRSNGQYQRSAQWRSFYLPYWVRIWRCVRSQQ